MRATLMYAAGDVRVEEVPDSAVKLPTDALVRVTASAICGSDLWPYASLKPDDGPRGWGTSSSASSRRPAPRSPPSSAGDLVVSPFAISDGTCEFCREGLPTSCVHPQAGFWDDAARRGRPGRGSPRPARRRHPRQAARRARPGPHPVAADPRGRPRHPPPRRRGRWRQPAHPRHRDRRRRRRPAGRPVRPAARRRAGHPHGTPPRARTSLGREFGVTDVVCARGAEGIAAVRDLAGGYGTHVVIEAVGTMAAYLQAVGIARPGGVISRVGVPQNEEAPIGWGSLFRHNIRLAGGPAPTRAYMRRTHARHPQRHHSAGQGLRRQHQPRRRPGRHTRTWPTAGSSKS